MAILLFDEIDCHCIYLSYIGRGFSHTPHSGYDLEHHISDFKTVVDLLEIKSYVLLAFSRGVGYACSYISNHPGKVKVPIIKGCGT